MVWLALFRESLPRVPRCYRLFKSFTQWMYRILAGRSMPELNGKIKRGRSPPTGRLDLKPSEFVRIKPQEEIEKTVDESGKNRGLGFDPGEIAPYCNRVFKVRRRVTRILDDETGRMLQNEAAVHHLGRCGLQSGMCPLPPQLSTRLPGVLV